MSIMIDKLTAEQTALCMSPRANVLRMDLGQTAHEDERHTKIFVAPLITVSNLLPPARGGRGVHGDHLTSSACSVLSQCKLPKW